MVKALQRAHLKLAGRAGFIKGFSTGFCGGKNSGFRRSESRAYGCTKGLRSGPFVILSEAKDLSAWVA
jgi:hypothetical protein